MSGTRALFASIGASVLLVAAAALSLLAVSAVFAFGGWSDPIAESTGDTALVLAVDKDNRDANRTKAFVLPPRARAQASRPAPRTGAVPAPRGSRAAEQAAITPAASRQPRASFPETSREPEPQAVIPPAPAAPKKSAGDGVRTAGEGLSGRVQNTGDALAQIIDPLVPPVTATTQRVLDAVAELLRRTTQGLGNTVDRVLPAR